MSEPNRIPKILEGFTIGEAITSHNGVVCYPAMRNNSDEKYILKIISLPASNVLLAAMLLSGAYSNRDDALAYYKDLAQEILRENRIMNELSNVEGFTPFLSCQLKEKEDRNGYEVWLLAPYHHSLEQIFTENVMTHQAIMDLAMDMCSALAACRRAGYLYIDLKPGNIFLDENKGYRIADLGFLSLSSLKYASLPEKYQSIYTAPEITDAVSQLNSTLDVYALGLVLYQAYNGGILPLENNSLPDPLLPPMYADYEMAQIILTACDPDPEKRWQDPAAFGQALVQYMQNYGVSNDSIVPAPVSTPELDHGEDFLPEEDISDPKEWEDIPELAFMQELVSDETAPTIENTSDILDSAMTDETTGILAQADALIAHVLPEPVVAPEMIHVPMPEPIILPEEPPEEIVGPEAAVPEMPAESTEVSEPEPEPEAEVEPEPEVPLQKESSLPAVTPAPPEEFEKPHRLRPKLIAGWVAAILSVILIIFFTVVGFDYYNNTYLQNIDQMILSGTVDSITVQIITKTDESLLRVTCSDTYGNTVTASLNNGKATFNGLSPQTRYTIRITINGIHKLTGAVTDSFTTASQTKVEYLTAVIGPEDGSVYLNFSVTGVECDQWILTYEAMDAPAQQITFSGHSVTVYDLIIGKEYTFTIEAGDESNIVGQTQVSYLAQIISRAQNPVITACGNGSLTVKWEQPQDTAVKQWSVRCYNSAGYDQTVKTEELTFTFSGLTHDTACTVEITADGMPQGVSVSVCANPISIYGYRYSLDGENNIVITWENSGPVPESGWLINWSCDNANPQGLEATENSVTIPYIPGGTYTISLIPVDETPIFGHTYTFTVEEAQRFAGFGITADNLFFTMCAVPDAPDWTSADIPESGYKTDFLSGEQAGFVVWCDGTLEESEETVTLTFILRHSDGTLADISVVEIAWNELWSQNMCQLTLPTMPSYSGDFRVGIYINGMLVTTQNFTVY